MGRFVGDFKGFECLGLPLRNLSPYFKDRKHPAERQPSYCPLGLLGTGVL